MNIGCDPEFFFKKKGLRGKIVESSVALPNGDVAEQYGSLIIRDGFQGELNPQADTCRQRLAGNIYRSMRKIEEMGYSMVLGAGYWVPKAEFASLSDDSKKFGCIPSENIYGEQGAILDATEYLFRPAGGHIHLQLTPTLKTRVGKVVRLLDIFVGNTCVPLDQDPLQVERRKNYGRAGEFRIKPYGVEYRTPSNFWLGRYEYMSMVFGLARMALAVASREAIADEVIELFRGPDIATAINENNKDLAIKNFLKLRPIIEKYFEVERMSQLEVASINSRTFDAVVSILEKGDDFGFHGYAAWKINRHDGWESYVLGKGKKKINLEDIDNDYVW
jgi:hypothetical protein